MKTDKDFYSFEEIKDEFIGKAGTPAREEYEADLRACLIGEAIRKARKGMSLTQAQSGEMTGVRRSQISKIERDRNRTFATAARIFKAMGIDAMIDMGALGRVAL